MLIVRLEDGRDENSFVFITEKYFRGLERL